ncbi:MAG: winged helix-turn-helix transcriptional regulator, partial [Syntrophobacterales bacterium]
MLLEKDFLILDAIDRYQPSSQRALANLCGMSLGRTNYAVKKLMKEGLVKMSKIKKESSRRRNAYVLTAKGMEDKAQMTTPFLKARMKEFEDFRNRLLENLLDLQDQGIGNLLVLGSRSVGNLLEHIARREHLEIRIIGTASEPDHFSCFATDAYDCI